jgi:hypothetical protein
VSAIRQAVEQYPTQKAFGAALTPPVPQSEVYRWLHRGWCPTVYAVQVEELTGVDRWTLVKPEIAALWKGGEK